LADPEGGVLMFGKPLQKLGKIVILLDIWCLIKFIIKISYDSFNKFFRWHHNTLQNEKFSLKLGFNFKVAIITWIKIYCCFSFQCISKLHRIINHNILSSPHLLANNFQQRFSDCSFVYYTQSFDPSYLDPILPFIEGWHFTDKQVSYDSYLHWEDHHWICQSCSTHHSRSPDHIR